MAVYTIKIVNNGRFPRNYTAFMPPPPSIGGADNAWASFENIPAGGFDSARYAPDVGRASAPTFIIAERDGAPGQVSNPAAAPLSAALDFIGLTQTTATVTQDADGAFTVTYS